MPWPREKESANSAPRIRPQHSQHMATHNHPSNRRSSSSNSHNNNPPACRRVLWIVLVSIACFGFSLRFVSPRGFFDRLTPPPLALLLIKKIIFPTHFSSFNVEVLVLLIKKIIFPTQFSSFNVEVLVLLVKKIIFPTHFTSFNVEVLVLLKKENHLPNSCFFF